MMFIDNKYTRCYYRIVSNAKLRPCAPDSYVEKHHIVPKSFYTARSKSGWLAGNPDVKDNIVLLTAREHLVCHRLLQRMTSGVAKVKMDTAAWRLCTVFRKDKRIQITSRTYEYIRKNHAVAQSIRITGRKRPDRTEALTGKKRPEHSASMKGRFTGKDNPRYGKPGTFKDKKHTAESLAKMRRPTGKQKNPRQKLTCEVCGIVCDASNFKKYGHGPNCTKNGKKIY